MDPAGIDVRYALQEVRGGVARGVHAGGVEGVELDFQEVAPPAVPQPAHLRGGPQQDVGGRRHRNEDREDGGRRQQDGRGEETGQEASGHAAPDWFR